MTVQLHYALRLISKLLKCILAPSNKAQAISMTFSRQHFVFDPLLQGDHQEKDPKMSETDITSLANKLQDLELGLKRQTDKEIGYGWALREAILSSNNFMEAEVLKSLGDLHLERGKLSRDSVEFDKAAALYAAALLRCKDPDIGQMLEHRIGYMEKLSRQLLQGYSPNFLWLSPDYWGTADSNVLRVAENCDKLIRKTKGIPWHSVEEIYSNTLVAAIADSDMFLEVEVLKSLGDFYLEKGKKTSDVSQFSKAAAMYKRALTRCGDPETKLTLEHRTKHMEKIREAVKKKLSRPKGVRPGMGHQLGNVLQNQHLHLNKTSQYKGHLKKGDSSLARADLDSAEQHFAAALKVVHERDPTAQQYQREVEPLCKLGDVYSKRGQQTGDGGDFVKAAALYNAAIARSNNKVLNGNIETAIIEVEKSFLKCIFKLDICHNVSLDNTENHKKQLKEMRDQIKLEMETIDQQMNPYVHDEDDPCVKEIEAKRAQAVRQLFENIAQQRKEFINLLVEECIVVMGPPPCKYALIGLGSQATGLVTPYSDLEFAILVEEEREQDNIIKVYFRNLTHYLHLKVVNLGETILPALGIKSLNDFYSENSHDNWYYDSVTPRGFAFDGSMPKASKTPLGKPPSELICTPNNLVSIMQNDVTLYLKEGYHLATILRNPCLIAGDEDLIDMYMGITVEILQADGGKMAQQLAQETLGENIKSYQFGNETVITAKLIDVKKKIYRFPAVAVDCLALSSGIIPTTVWETIEEMENKQVISPNNAHHLTVLTSISAELRLRTYIANGGQKENLSALASMETTQHRQESSQQTNDEEQTTALKAAFHVPNQKQLFRYYYTAVPLKSVLSKFIGEKPTLGQLSDFYDASSRVQGDMYHELCKYKLAISYFEEAIHAVRTDPEKMQLLRKLGVAWDKSGDYQKAISYFEQELQMYRSMFGQGTAHSEIFIARTLNNLGSALGDLGKHREAISYLEQALQMSRSFYGQGIAHSDIAMSLNNIGLNWVGLGDYRKAISYYEQALKMHRSIHGQTTSHHDIAISLNNLGSAWHQVAEYRKAISYHEQALQMYRSIYGQTTAHPDIAKSIMNLGKTWCHVGDHRKAISYYEQGLQMNRSIYTYGESTVHPSIAISLVNIGSAWDRLGEHRKAISYNEQALEMYRSIYGQNSIIAHPDIATLLNNIGSAWQGLGDYIKAISYYEQAVKMYRDIHGQSTAHPDIAMSLNNLGLAWNSIHDFKKSGNNLSVSNFKKPNGISYLEQSLQMIKSIYGQSMAHPHIALTLCNIGWAWKKFGDHRKAVQYYEQALQIQRSIFGQSAPHPDTALTLHNLGIILHDLGNHRKGINYCEQALQMRKSIYGENTAHPDIAISLNVLGGNYADFGDHRKAISYLEQSLQMRQRIHGENTAHPDIATSLNNLGCACQHVGNHREATNYYKQALQMYRSTYGQNTAHPDIVASLINVGSTWHLFGEYSIANKLFQEGLAMARQVYPQDKTHPVIKLIESKIAETCAAIGKNSADSW
ncbi:uncharacterized protein LOC144877535 [Branchiostoma floridae x Branchiostoma japonicum]